MEAAKTKFQFLKKQNKIENEKLSSNGRTKDL